MEKENGHDRLTDKTRADLKDLSKAMLRLHKTMLDAAKLDFEAKHGRITSVNHYFQLVIDDEHFAWLRKISALIALLDEAISIRRPATESDALGLFHEAKALLNFEDADEGFNSKFQTALSANADAVINHNDALSFVNGRG